MKKYLYILMLLLLTGCSSKYQISDLKVSSGSPYYIEGVFKNNSDTYCKYVTIDVEIKSGSLKLDYQLSLLNSKPGEIKNVHTYCDNCKNIDVSNATIKVKNINCSE